MTTFGSWTANRVFVVPHLSEMSGAPWMAARIATDLDPEQFECLTGFPSEGPLLEWMRGQRAAVEVLDLLPLSYAEAARSGRRWDWLASRYRYAMRFLEELKRFRPDVVYVHSAMQLLPGMLAWADGVPVVWHVQETLDMERWSIRVRGWWIKRLSHSVIFCGWTPRRQFGRCPRGQVWKVVPNALTREPWHDPGARESVRAEFRIPADHAVLVSVGGVHPRKGLDVLLKSLTMCLAKGRDRFTLLVAGGAGAAPKRFLRRIESRLDRDGLRDRVRMLGHRDDIPRLLAGSDLFVLASRNEGLPLSVVEAFAAGIPAVLTDTGDCAILAGHGKRGLCVPVDNAVDFALAVVTLLDDPDRRRLMGTAARTLVEKRFLFPRLIDDVSAILSAAARKGGR